MHDEDRKRIQFRMRDIRYYVLIYVKTLCCYLVGRFVQCTFFLFRSGKNLACCLWGSYAEKIENLARDSLEETTVWLLRFAKIGEFRGNCFLNILFLITKNDPQCFFY